MCQGMGGSGSQGFGGGYGSQGFGGGSQFGGYGVSPWMNQGYQPRQNWMQQPQGFAPRGDMQFLGDQQGPQSPNYYNQNGPAGTQGQVTNPYNPPPPAMFPWVQPQYSQSGPAGTQGQVTNPYNPPPAIDPTTMYGYQPQKMA
jgi:hypothetical protein